MNIVVFLLLGLCLSFHVIESYRILILSPVGNKSHKIFYMGIAKELLNRGHHVTIVSAYSESAPMPNFRDIVLTNATTVQSLVENIFEEGSNDQLMKDLLYKTHIICSDSLQSKEVQELKNENFDVIMMSQFFGYCYHALVYHFQVPYIYISSIGLEGFAEMSGQLKYPSFVPNVMAGASYPLSFTDRALSELYYWLGSLFYQCILYKSFQATCQERGLCPPDMPSLYDMDKNVSLVIVNSVRTLEIPINPAFPNVVFAGGAHIKQAKPLPVELETWINGSGDAGFIFFSLGSNVKSTVMPERFRKIIIDTFGSLEQRVLMKWDGEIADLPANIKVEKWLPQADILGHSKICLFVTHGGLLSTLEATYHGVPLLGLPLFADQLSNIKQAVNQGWARMLKWNNFTDKSFTDTITDILKDQNLRELSKTRSNLMKDVPVNPAEDAAFWVEYVIRNKGAPNLWSPIYHLSWIEIMNLDVWAVIISFVILLIFVIFKIIMCIVHCCLGTSKNKKD